MSREDRDISSFVRNLIYVEDRSEQLRDAVIEQRCADNDRAAIRLANEIDLIDWLAHSEI